MYLDAAENQQLGQNPRFLEHRYRVELPQAIAVVEAIGLRHRKVWIDASLDAEELASASALGELLVRRRRRRDELWLWVGRGALVFVLSGLLGLL